MVKQTVKDVFEVLGILFSSTFGFHRFHTYCCCCSVAESSPTLRDPMDGGTPGFPALRYLLELAQIHVNCDGDCYPILYFQYVLYLFKEFKSFQFHEHL